MDFRVADSRLKRDHRRVFNFREMIHFSKVTGKQNESSQTKIISLSKKILTECHYQYHLHHQYHLHIAFLYSSAGAGKAAGGTGTS